MYRVLLSSGGRPDEGGRFKIQAHALLPENRTLISLYCFPEESTEEDKMFKELADEGNWKNFEGNAKKELAIIERIESHNVAILTNTDLPEFLRDVRIGRTEHAVEIRNLRPHRNSIAMFLILMKQIQAKTLRDLIKELPESQPEAALFLSCNTTEVFGKIDLADRILESGYLVYGFLNDNPAEFDLDAKIEILQIRKLNTFKSGALLSASIGLLTALMAFIIS